MATCIAPQLFRHCETRQYRIVGCRRWHCPACGRALARRWRAVLSWATEHGDPPQYLLTLTLRDPLPLWRSAPPADRNAQRDGVDTVIAAELLAGIGAVERFATADKLARYAGIAPKEWSSVGRGRRTRSDHGRRSLHRAFYHIALIHVGLNRNGTVRCPESRAYYEKKLAEGKSRKAALICLMRVLVRIVWRMLTKREPYWKQPAEAVA